MVLWVEEEEVGEHILFPHALAARLLEVGTKVFLVSLLVSGPQKPEVEAFAEQDNLGIHYLQVCLAVELEVVEEVGIRHFLSDLNPDETQIWCQ